MRLLLLRQVDEKHACRKFACKFQACLKQHGFQNMDKCQREIDDMRRCCAEYNGISVHCSFADYGTGKDDYSGTNSSSWEPEVQQRKQE